MTEHPLSTLKKLDPVIMDHLEKTNELVYGEGALPKKYKYLIAMAFDAAHGAVNGVRSLAQSALREGASKEEIAETFRVAYQLCGVGSLYIGSQGLKDII
ncbi:MAG: carboxymuconolactone decarboxylase family protein [Calditrichota bacterium]|jgi:alkylhydroperoxidase/carboxymuconolactone decarboxylase family protein YurZ